jgi:hypothetical protein
MATKKVIMWPRTYKNLMNRKLQVERDAGVRIPMTRWLHYLSTKPVFIDIPIKYLAKRKFKLDDKISY